MPIFTLYCENPETGLRARFFYDNLTSELLREDGSPVLPPADTAPSGDPIHFVSRDVPGIKSAPLTLKIQLGLGCNHACSYCNQRGQAEGARAARGADVERLLAGLPGWFDGGAQGDGTGCRMQATTCTSTPGSAANPCNNASGAVPKNGSGRSNCRKGCRLSVVSRAIFTGGQGTAKMTRK